MSSDGVWFAGHAATKGMRNLQTLDPKVGSTKSKTTPRLQWLPPDNLLLLESHMDRISGWFCGSAPDCHSVLDLLILEARWRHPSSRTRYTHG